MCGQLCVIMFKKRTKQRSLNLSIDASGFFERNLGGKEDGMGKLEEAGAYLKN